MANVLRVSFLPSTPPQFALKPGAHHGLLLWPHPSLPVHLCPSCCSSGLNLCPSSVAVSMMNTTEASGGEQAGDYFTEQQETEGKSGQL